LNRDGHEGFVNGVGHGDRLPIRARGPDTSSRKRQRDVERSIINNRKKQREEEERNEEEYLRVVQLRQQKEEQHQSEACSLKPTPQFTPPIQQPTPSHPRHPVVVDEIMSSAVDVLPTLISTGLTAHNNHTLPTATASVVTKPSDADTPRDVGKFNGYTFGLLYIFSQMTTTLNRITPHYCLYP
jgi:hypothetical protein